MTTLGLVEQHFLLCPFCGGRAALADHRCSGCGALAEAIVWRSAGPWSPELALVSGPTLSVVPSGAQRRLARR